MAQIPLKDLVPVPRQKIVTDRAGESSVTLVRTVQGSPLSSRWTGADEGSGIVTLDLQKVAGLGSNAAPALLALQYDNYGRIVAVKPAQVDYNSLTNLPNLPVLIANEVQSQISALNLLDAAAVRRIVVEHVDTLRIRLEELIRQLMANLQPGMSEEQVRQIVAAEVGKLKLPISWTSAGIIEVINNAITTGQIKLPGGVNIDLTQYFNSTEGGVLLRQIIQQVVSAMLPDFLRQWFVDNPLDKPDQHLFAYSGDGTIAGFIGNQINRYRYGNPQLLAIERLPTADVTLELRKNGTVLSTATVTPAGVVSWSATGVVTVGYTDRVTLTTTSLHSATGVMLTLANADAAAAAVGTTAPPLEIPVTMGAANNLLHQLQPTMLAGQIIWMNVMPFPATVSLDQFRMLTDRAPSVTPATFSLWKGAVKLADVTFNVGQTAGAVTNVLAPSVTLARGEFLFMQCHLYSDCGSLAHDLPIKPAEDQPMDTLLAGCCCSSLPPKELFRFVAVTDTLIDLENAIFSAVTADLAKSSVCYWRVNGVGVASVRFAENARAGVVIGDKHFTLHAGDILTLEGGVATDLSGLVWAVPTTLPSQPRWLVDILSASYIGDAPLGAVLTSRLITESRTLRLAESVARLSVAGNGFGVTVRRNGAAVATITYQPSAVVGEIVATAGGTTINLLAGDFVDVVVSTGTAYRPAISLVLG